MCRLSRALSAITALVCVSCVTPQVTSHTVAFYHSSYVPHGSIMVLPFQSEEAHSLEFEHYRGKIEAELKSVGYTITRDFDAAEQFAYVGYGLESGTPIHYTIPIMGQTGGGMSYTSGTIRSTSYSNSSLDATYQTGRFSATSTSPPAYGVVGTTSGTIPQYDRTFLMDIVDGPTLRLGAPIKILELTTSSSGSCSQINEVMDEILQATFEDFPPASGQSVKRTVPGEFNC